MSHLPAAMMPGHEDREDRQAGVHRPLRLHAAMMPGHEDREDVSGGAACTQPATAAMMPGHEDREDTGYTVIAIRASTPPQ